MSTAASNPMHQRRPGANSNNNGNGNMHGGGYRDVEGGGNVRGRGGGRANDANSGIMEQQNNERIDELSDQVARLKGLTIDIGNEVREQNSLLDGIGDTFSNTGDLLQGSLRRIGTMLESGGTKHMCYMVAFIVLVMMFLWWLMSYKGSSGA
jgi:blocked-early-in-transport protein 1